MKNTHLKHISELLLATMFIGTSGVFGKYIDMPSPVLVWWRAALAILFLYLFSKLTKINLRVSVKKDYFTFILSGIFMAAHWITYFYALKLSNVALGMLSLYTFPVITALLEPVFLKTKFNVIHLLLGGIVLLGIYILAPEFNLESSHVQGVLLGVLSALCYAIRNLLLKPHLIKYDGTMLMLHQMIIVTVLLTPVLFFMDTSTIVTQYPYVLLLALLTTAIGHTIMVRSFKNFSVSTASIISSFQPIFGVLLAFIFLNEIPTLNTFFGGLLILSTVVVESIRSKKQ
jgi:drug/metabolite transporter (DMT)-like permease